MTWDEAKNEARRIMKSLSAEFQPEAIRLILRALNRQHHKEKAMQRPQIIVLEPSPGTFQISVSGRFGGGFSNLTTDRSGVISKLTYLKSFDCGDEPAAVIVPETLQEEFRMIFPKSFSPRNES